MKTTRFITSTLFLISSTFAQVNVPPEFDPNATFQITIQHTLDITAPLQPADATVWDVDLYHVARNPGVIEYLRSRNSNPVTIICYFNAGLVQHSDCDFDTVWNTTENRHLLGNGWGEEFPDEFWINIKDQKARDLIKTRIALAAHLGCDGVDPDNIDGYGVDSDPDEENKTGWNLTEDDDERFILDLATYAHTLTTKRGFTMLIGQKNAPELAERVEASLDFAVLEDCKELRDGGEGFCNEYTRYVEKGKPVFSIEYPRTLEGTRAGSCRTTGASQAEYTAACDERGNDLFSTVLKIKEGEGELNGCTQYCSGNEVGTGVVVTAEDSTLDGGECVTLP